jgi:hypothetical protein
MGRYASDTGSGDFQQAPAGSHLARCIKITDLGTQAGEYKGVPNHKSQILISWELPSELMEDDKPFIVSGFYTNSLAEKANLRHHLVSWRGREFTLEELGRFDLNTILNAPCMLSVIHNDKNKAKVDAVMKLPKGMECPPAVNATFAFWLDEFSQAEFDKLGKGIKEIIAKSPEYQAAVSGKVAPEPLSGNAPKFDDSGFEDDIPF